MNSCIYEGELVHRRFQPVPHAFRSRLFLMYLDLAELPEVFRGRWLWSTTRPALARFRREDYPGPATEPLDETIRTMVERATGRRPNGPIRLLTHLRYFGLGFNPVSFFYCFDDAGERVDAVVAHVTSTPWGETHSYVVARQPGDERRLLRGRAAKQLHVSPFLPMDLTHEFRFTRPAARLEVAIRDQRGGECVFTAGARLERREITTASLASVLVRHPAMTARVLGGIYWQALRLWWKGVPYHPHPREAAGPNPPDPASARSPRGFCPIGGASADSEPRSVAAPRSRPRTAATPLRAPRLPFHETRTVPFQEVNP